MAAQVQRTLSIPELQKPPKKRFIFAAILVAGLSLASSPVSPIPENPYTLFPVATLPPNPYTICERTEGICAPRVVIRQKKDLKEYGIFSSSQVNSAKQSQAGETLKKLKWLYEGTPVEKALSSFPPIVFESQLSLEGVADLSPNKGAQLQNTNLALLDFGKDSRPSERELILAHELIHYISWLGSGWEASYLFQGEKISTMSPEWLAEGMANWAACRTLEFSCILNPEGTGLKAYHTETYIMAFLEMLSGKEALRKALVSGDFAQVQSALDKSFGKGTFEQLMDKESISDALIFLALRTRGFQESPSSISSPHDAFTADALSFLRNSTQLLVDGGYLSKQILEKSKF